VRKLVFLSVLLCACSAQDVSGAQEGDEFKLLRCYEHGAAPGLFCRASMLQVIAARGIFDSRQVIVPGFVGDIEGDLYLFPSKEFYRSRDLSSSVRLIGNTELLKDKISSNVVVFGLFTLEAPDPSTLMKPAGAISLIHVRNGFNRDDDAP
jgi:hypothetical protein